MQEQQRGRMAQGSRMPEESTTLRERQAQQVAADIRHAFVRLVNRTGPNGFSLRDVATEAGVSERTLYRYYPGRDELVRAVQDHENADLERQLAAVRAHLTDLSDPETVARVFEVFEANRDLVEASGLLRASGDDHGASASRTDEVHRIVSRDFDLSDEGVRQLVGVIRAISSSAGWLRMTAPDVGLDSREAGHAAQWALEVLLAAARDESGPLRPRGDRHDAHRRRS